MKEIIATEDAPKAVGPYSQAVRSGNILFVSGQLPLDPDTGTMPEGAADQARQSMKNIKAILEAAGSGMDRVLRCGIFLANMDDFGAVNEVYASFFEGDYPARATVEVSRLPLGALVEIDAIAEV